MYIKMIEKTNEWRKYMETWYYEVVSIDGDYANLKRIDIESSKISGKSTLLAEIYERCQLKYELMQYFMEN